MDGRIRTTFRRLNIPIQRNGRITISTVFSSISITAACHRGLTRRKVVFYSFNRTVRSRPRLIHGCLNAIIPKGSGFFTTLGTTMTSSNAFVCIPGNIHYPVRLSACFHVGTRGAKRFRHAVLITSRSDCIDCVRNYSTPIHSDCRLRTTIIRIVVRGGTRIGCSAMRG